MPLVAWPSSREVHAAIRDRLAYFLAEHAGLVAETGRRIMAAGHGPFSDQPHSLTSILAPGACLAAGGDWRMAVWPGVGAECMMAAADLFDDVADADPGSDAAANPAVSLTAAAGLLSLAGVAVVRVVEDGASDTTAVALARLLGVGFAAAANGQAANLQPRPRAFGALAAYAQSAAKSGPLGSLIARLGARTATADPQVVDLLGEFGRRLAVGSQLLNDVRDAAPDAADAKSDVRAGARTVPLVFAGSNGAPAGLDEPALLAWEQRERRRILASGGLAAAMALAEAERLGAGRALDSLERLGCTVGGLRELSR